MKFTLSWLKDHLDTSASLDEISDTLTRIGLEVEDIKDRAAELKSFKVAHILEATQHPNADKLRVCRVLTAEGEVQVVCGAPNARTGLKVVFAPIGSTIPANGLVLKPTKIRDVESSGMLVSMREMGLSDEHEGIIELPADAPVGQPFAPLFGLDDPVIEIAVTPNRADALSVYGVARDLAAAGLGTLKSVRPQPVSSTRPCPVHVTIEDEKLCPLFALRLVTGVKNHASPEWMQTRLKAIGLRPISALVDITNYLTFDQGRPLHVFDADKVSGNLDVRRARDGEKLDALDGRELALDTDMIVIADDNGPQSLAGIMGGAATGCTEATTNVLIESALWDNLSIARTGRKLNINSDARHRFERGVDPAFTLPGLDAATRLVLDICGGEASGILQAGTLPVANTPIAFRITEVERLTGMKTHVQEIKDALTGQGFEISGTGDVLNVTPPSWRADVAGQADLVEDAVRILGLDRVTATPLPPSYERSGPMLNLSQRRTQLARRALAARGFLEAVTWSFISQAQAKAFGGGDASLALANPISSDLTDMRPSLLPGLLLAAQRNADRGFGDVALFEVGQVFAGRGADRQHMLAAGVRRGTASPTGTGRHWQQTAEAVNVFDAKADALAMLAALNVPVANVQVEAGGANWLHPGRSGTLKMGPKIIFGYFGELHPRIMKELDISGALAVFEINLDALPVPKTKATRARSALEKSDLQPVSRDFAFVVDKSVPAGDVVRAVQTADRALITDVQVFDVYQGKGVAEDKKSVAVALTLQPKSQTLTDADLEALTAKVIAQVKKVTGGDLRA
jgi:phenylalanyl-tRNA synthetase beta chain